MPLSQLLLSLLLLLLLSLPLLVLLLYGRQQRAMDDRCGPPSVLLLQATAGDAQW